MHTVNVCANEDMPPNKRTAVKENFCSDAHTTQLARIPCQHRVTQGLKHVTHVNVRLQDYNYNCERDFRKTSRWKKSCVQ